MIWQRAMKYPVLITGIIMFIIFLTDKRTKIWWNEISMRYIPSTCGSLKSRMGPKLLDHWRIRCAEISSLILTVKMQEEPLETANVRPLYYRVLANELQTFALKANPETLNSLEKFKLYLKGKQLKIVAQTDGEALVQLRSMKNKERIAEHLRLTVKVKELAK